MGAHGHFCGKLVKYKAITNEQAKAIYRVYSDQVPEPLV